MALYKRDASITYAHDLFFQTVMDIDEVYSMQLDNIK